MNPFPSHIAYRGQARGTDTGPEGQVALAGATASHHVTIPSWRVIASPTTRWEEKATAMGSTSKLGGAAEAASSASGPKVKFVPFHTEYRICRVPPPVVHGSVCR